MKEAHRRHCMRRMLQCFSISWIFLQHSLVTVNSFKINYSCHPSWIVVCVWKAAVNCAWETAAEAAAEAPQLQVSCLLNTNDCLKHYCLHSADFNVCITAFNHAASLWRTVRVTVSVLVNLHGRCSRCSSTKRHRWSCLSWIQWVVLKALEERRLLGKTSVQSDKAALTNSNLPSFSHSQSPWSLSRKRRTLRSTKLCWPTTCSPSRPGQRTVSTSHSTTLPYLPPFMRG